VLFLQIHEWNFRAGFRIEAVSGLGEEHLDASGAHLSALRNSRPSGVTLSIPRGGGPTSLVHGLDRMAALSHMAAMIIAIDGPAASGKGTLGKRLAHHYGYRHLDTGVIYRAVAKALLDEGFELTDEARAVAVAMELDPERFGHPELKSQRIGDAASVVSAIPSVREALVSFQRQFAADPPGAVLDGRDIGTVICPNADVKIFVVADPQVRARRRTLEALARGEAADEAMVLADILKRDERDRNRAAAPLKAAEDAHILDNSNLDIEGGVRAAIAIVEAVRAGR
jgi:CMP/dCMP kinase